jgi:predicted transcriptional regulator
MSTLMIHQELRRRLDRLAKRMGLSTTALANLWLEAAVHDEERRLARDQRVTRELEAVLVRAILRGEDDRSARTPGVTPR